MLLILSACSLNAQKFTASANRTHVAAGDQMEVTFSVNGTQQVSNFKAPSFADFDVLFGPSQSSNISIINGNMTQSISFTYLLMAKKEGSFTIGPASVDVGGSHMESNSISIEVSKGNYQQQRQQGGNQDTYGQSQSSSLGDKLFVRTITSRSKAYQGEMITVSHKVYSQLNLKGFQDATYPAYNGFWSQEVPRPAQYEVTTENFEGTMYYVVELKKTFLFPQRSGSIEIEPMEVSCIVREKTNKSSSFWDQFWGIDSYKDAVYKVKSKPVKIDVMPLPEGKPASFSGQVGSYVMQAEINKNEVKANSGIDLKLTFSGKGNLKLIDAPKLNFPKEFETFDPKLADNVSVTNSGISGSKTFDYLVIPRTEGNYRIDPYEFSFFDTEKKSYVTLRSPEFNIRVSKDENASQATVIGEPNHTEVQVIAQDIRFIRTGNIQLYAKGRYFFNSPGFYAVLSVPPLLFFLFLFFRRKHLEQNSDLALVRQRKASRMARKRLSAAEKLMQLKKQAEFFTEVHSAVYGYLGDKLRIPLSEMSKEVILQKLAVRNVNEELAKGLVTLIETCEFARYAPSGDAEMNRVYEDAVTTIVKLEDAL